MWLVVVRDQEGRICAKVPLTGAALTVGRSKDRSIVLESKSISRFHGRFEVRDNQVVYIDEGSANGSKVDGKPVTAAAAVTDLSLIELGEFRIGILKMTVGKTEKSGRAAIPATLEMPNEPATIAAVRQAAAAGDSMDLTPMAAPASSPPARPAPVFKSPVEGMQFRIPEAPAVQQMPSTTARLSDSVAGLLERQIQGIQNQRSEVENTMRTAKESFEQQWRDAITGARALQAKLQGNRKVLYYVVSRDEQEVSAKISDTSKRGFCNLVLSKRHPEKGNVQEGIVWFGEFGDEPRAYKEPKDALEDFVRRIASKLA
mgnify:CR=1 FL=1